MFVSGRDNELDIIQAFNNGADEYLILPIRIREFIVRINSLIKRCQYQNYNRIVEIGNLTFNRNTNSVTLGKRKINLTPIETKILRLLIENAGYTVSTQQFIDEI